MKALFLRRFIPGLLLFIPLFVLAYGLLQFYKFSGRLTETVFRFADVDRAMGTIGLNLAALGLVLFVIYLLGFLADLPVIRTRVPQLDRALTAMIPGYAMAKGMIGGVVKEDAMTDGFRPVLVRCVDGHRLGFEVERTQSGLVVVFLPDSPSAKSGVSIGFEPDQVARLNLPPHKAAEIMSFYGRGLGAEIEKVLASDALAPEGDIRADGVDDPD